MTTAWNDRYAMRTQQMQGGAIQEFLSLAQRPGIISFGGGLPAAELFPAEAFEVATRCVLGKHSAQALQYGTTEGYLPLLFKPVKSIFSNLGYKGLSFA